MLSNSPDRNFAIIIGTTRFPEGERLRPLPSVRHNLNAMFEILSGFVEPTNVLELRDRIDVPKTLKRIAEHAGKVPEDGGLLLYYSGHGLNDEQGLYLALEETSETNYKDHALPFERIAEIVKNSDARKKIVVVECCHAGQATNESFFGNNFVLESAALIAAAREFQTTPAGDGDGPTPFTSVLLDGLNGLVPGHEPAISIVELCDFIREQAQASNELSLPQYELAGGGVEPIKIAYRHSAWTASYADLIRKCTGVHAHRALPSVFDSETDRHELTRSCGTLCQKILAAEMLKEIRDLKRLFAELVREVQRPILINYRQYCSRIGDQIASGTDQIRFHAARGAGWGAFRSQCHVLAMEIDSAGVAFHRAILANADVGKDDADVFPDSIRTNISPLLTSTGHILATYEQRFESLYNAACDAFVESVDRIISNV